MLQQLGVERVRLITNNPAKIASLRALGIDVTGRIPSLTPTNPHSAGYLETKRVRMGHMLDDRDLADGTGGTDSEPVLAGDEVVLAATRGAGQTRGS